MYHANTNEKRKQEYNKSPTYEPSSYELSKMQMCVHMSDHIRQFMCLVYIVMCVHPLQVVVLLCTLLYRAQYLYFKPMMSGSKHKSSDIAGTLQPIVLVGYLG